MQKEICSVGATNRNSVRANSGFAPTKFTQQTTHGTMTKMKVYFDNAATTKTHPEVVQAMLPYFSEYFGNPSSVHSFGRTPRAAVEQVRKKIAEYLNASASEIIFLSSGTEANNMVIKQAVQDLNVQHIVTSNIEHKCVFNVVKEAHDKGAQIHYIKADGKGRIHPKDVEEKLKHISGKTLVSIMHANNELGTINDIEAIGKICKEYNVLFHSDTVQTVAHFPIDVQACNVDYISGSAHKFHGPNGIGFLYMHQKAKLSALLQGGGQERGYRSGTENVAGIIGMGKAFEIACENMESDRQHILEIKNYFKQQLKENFDDLQFLGCQENSLYTVLTVSFPASFSDMLHFKLDMEGIAISAGSACASGAKKGSHVLQAIGHPEDRNVIRFSFCEENTKEEVDYVVVVLLKISAFT